MSEKSYIDWYAMSDEQLQKTLGSFVRHHRIAQNKSQEVVAKAANLSRSTLSLLERGETVSFATVLQVLRVLELLYVMDGFRIQQTISPIALAKREQTQRKRASGLKKSDSTKSDW